MFFIAYNWDDLGRFAKFGLVQVFIIGSIGVYWFSNRKTKTVANDHEQGSNNSRNIIGQAALLSASIFLGVLLAFFAKLPALWMLWVLLVNLSIILYYAVFQNTFNILFSSEISFIWLIALTNTAILIFWELIACRLKWLAQAWAVRTLASVCGTTITILVLFSIFEYRSEQSLEWVFWLSSMIAVYLAYYKRTIDLFMLSIACLSGIIVITSFVSHTLFEETQSAAIELVFLIMTILIIGMGTGTAKLLKFAHRKSLDQENTIKQDTSSAFSKGEDHE